MSGTQVLLRSSQVWQQLLVHQDQLLVLLVAALHLPRVRDRHLGAAFQVLGTRLKDTKELAIAMMLTLGAAGESHTRAPGEGWRVHLTRHWELPLFPPWWCQEGLDAQD